MTCLDWTELKLRYCNVNITTVPIEAPEGVLGALTGAAGPKKPEEELVLGLQTLAQQLAHGLTFCKCKNDLQVCLEDHQPSCEPSHGCRLQSHRSSAGSVP